MSDSFDPYHKWLGIPPVQQPPTHYRLLGLETFESDREVIDAAANQRMAYLQEVAGGEHSRESQKLLNEVAAARRCLLNLEKKEQYDAGLTAKSTLPVSPQRKQGSETTLLPVSPQRKQGPESTPLAGAKDSPPDVVLAFADLKPGVPAHHSEPQTHTKRAPAGLPPSKLPWLIGGGLAIVVLAVVLIAQAVNSSSTQTTASEDRTLVVNEPRPEREIDKPKPPPIKGKEIPKPPIDKAKEVPKVVTPPATAPDGPACRLHFMPTRNLSGDPAGFLLHEGTYHLFYQPTIGTKWTNLDLWGHAVSTDLLVWTELPVKHSAGVNADARLASVVIDHGNTSGLGRGKEPPFIAFYTLPIAGKKEEKTRERMAIHLAHSSDRGATWTAHPKNPVLILPPSIDRQATVVRHEPSGQWVMLTLRPLASGKAPDGEVKWHVSKDLTNWTQQSEPKLPAGPDAPDLFTAALAGNPKQHKTVCRSGDGRYEVGNYDGKSFNRDSGLIVSPARGLTSPRVLSNPPGAQPRPLQMAGLAMLKKDENSPFAFPQELIVAQIKKDPTWRVLRVMPRELEKLRGKERTWKDIEVKKGSNPFDDLTGDLLEFEIDLQRTTAAEFTIDCAGEKLRYSFDKRRWFAEGYEVAGGDGKIIRLRGYIDRDVLEFHYGPFPGTTARIHTAMKGNRPLEVTVAEGSVKIVLLRVFELRLPPKDSKKFAAR